MGDETKRPVLSMAPSRPRLVIGTGVLVALGGLVLEVAVTGAFGFGPRMTLLTLASAAFVLAYRLWSSGRVTLELRDGALREAGVEGRVLARLDEIRAVERGTFAFKPSNGFLLRLTARAPAAWVPGLWWRAGRLIGVGGLVPAYQARLVAEAVSIELSERRAAPEP